MAPQLRAVAAAARETLLDLAAERWKVDRATARVAERQDRRRRDAKQSFAFGELTQGREAREDARRRRRGRPVTPATKWKVAGTSVPKVDGRDFVTGAHQYPSDMTRPGMLYGKVLRPPASRRRSPRSTPPKAEAMPGVKVVRDGDFVGVVAPDAYTAEQALAALAGAKWTEPPAQPSERDHLRLPQEERRAAGGGARRAAA